MSYNVHDFKPNEILRADQLNEMDAQIKENTERIEALEYAPIAINSFSVSPATIEKGSSTTVTATWNLNKTATSQTINGASVTGTSKTYSNVTADITYSLYVSDGKKSAEKTAKVTTANQIYWGVAANTSSVTVLANKALSNTKTRTITVDAGSGQYIIYALPKRLGTVTFWVNGFEGGFGTPETKSLTNASGFAEDYYIYKSENVGLGNTTIEIK